MASVGDGEQLWRPNRAGLAAGCVFVLGGIAAAAYLARHSQPDLATLAVLFAVGGWRYGLHPSVAAADEGVVIRNPFRRVTVPWGQVEGALPGSRGIIVLRTDRRPGEGLGGAEGELGEADHRNQAVPQV